MREAEELRDELVGLAGELSEEPVQTRIAAVLALLAEVLIDIRDLLADREAP